MSILTVNAGNVKNQVSLRQRRIGKSIRIINNQPGSIGTPKGTQAAKVNKLKAKLMIGNNIRIQQTHQTLGDASLEILSNIGCVCIKDKEINHPNYSLIATQTDQETIDNPNKIDSAVFSYITKGKVTFKNVLKDELNPFYKLDRGPSKNIINELEQLTEINEYTSARDFEHIAVRFYDMNLHNQVAGMPTIRALK